MYFFLTPKIDQIASDICNPTLPRKSILDFWYSSKLIPIILIHWVLSRAHCVHVADVLMWYMMADINVHLTLLPHAD